MKRTTLLGKPLLYKVGKMDMLSEDYSQMSDDGLFSGGGGASTSNVLPPVTDNAEVKYETDVVPVPYAEPITNTNTGTTPTPDASQGTTPTPTADSVTNDAPLTPITTPDGTGTSSKLSSNWWWVLGAAALAYKLSKN